MEGKRLASMRGTMKGTNTGDLEAKTAVLSKGTCHRHPNQVTNHMCMTCLTVHCDLCKSSHIGHDIKRCTGDAGESKFIQKVIRSQIQALYGVFDLVESNKENMNVKRSTVKEAKIAVRDTVKQIVDTATDLGRKAEEELDDLEKAVETEEHTINEHAKTVDDKIARLTVLRNVSDTDILLPEAAETAAILEEFDTTQTGHENSNVGLMTPILPNLAKVNDVICELGKMLLVDSTADKKSNSTRNIEYDYSAAMEVDQIPIQNTETDDHRICDADVNDGDSIVMHGLREQDIHSYNIKTGNINNFITKSVTGIFDMVKVPQNEFVVNATAEQGLQLFDANYAKKIIQDVPHNFQSICYNSKNTFISMTKTDNYPSTVTLKRITVDKGKLIPVKEIAVQTENCPYIISCQSHTNLLSMVSDDRLYTVDMDTSALSTHDISPYVSDTVCSLYVDTRGNTLVGDNDGNVHWFDTQMKHSMAVKISGEVWGITIRGEYMFVTADRKIWTFRMPIKQ